METRELQALPEIFPVHAGLHGRAGYIAAVLFKHGGKIFAVEIPD
jgi:hypothetical protein